MLCENDRKYKIGVDFGGSHFGVIITDDTGKPLTKVHMNIDVSKLANQEEKENVIMDNIIPIIEGCIKNVDIDKTNINFIGIGVPGAYRGTKIVYVPNMGLKDFDVGEAFRNKLNGLGLNEKEVDILVENDANCAAVGEKVAGALKGITNGINIVFGTGVGAGIILNGKLYKGENNCAGEIGHMVIDRNSNIQCGCGQMGCLETLCSLKRLRENISNILSLNVTIDGIELVGILNRIYNREKREIVEKIHTRNSIVLELLNERNTEEIYKLYETYKEDLVKALVSVINMFDPKRISIGGSLSYFIESDLEEIVKRVNEHTFYKGIDNCEIVKAMLENDAGLIGAAMLGQYTI